NHAKRRSSAENRRAAAHFCYSAAHFRRANGHSRRATTRACRATSRSRGANGQMGNVHPRNSKDFEPRVPMPKKVIIVVTADAPRERVLAESEPFSVNKTSPFKMDDAASHFHSLNSKEPDPLRTAGARIATERAGCDALEGWFGYEEGDLSRQLEDYERENDQQDRGGCNDPPHCTRFGEQTVLVGKGDSQCKCYADRPSDAQPQPKKYEQY